MKTSHSVTINWIRCNYVKFRLISGQKWVEAQWFYRQNDISPTIIERAGLRLSNKDIFSSTHNDMNMVESIVGPCRVFFTTADIVDDLADDVYLCRFKYTSRTKGNGGNMLVRLKKSDLPDAAPDNTFFTEERHSSTSSAKTLTAGSEGLLTGTSNSTGDSGLPAEKKSRRPSTSTRVISNTTYNITRNQARVCLGTTKDDPACDGFVAMFRSYHGRVMKRPPESTRKELLDHLVKVWEGLSANEKKHYIETGQMADSSHGSTVAIRSHKKRIHESSVSASSFATTIDESDDRAPTPLPTQSRGGYSTRRKGAAGGAAASEETLSAGSASATGSSFAGDEAKREEEGKEAVPPPGARKRRRAVLSSVNLDESRSNDRGREGSSEGEGASAEGLTSMGGAWNNLSEEKATETGHDKVADTASIPARQSSLRQPKRDGSTANSSSLSPEVLKTLGGGSGCSKESTMRDEIGAEVHVSAHHPRGKEESADSNIRNAVTESGGDGKQWGTEARQFFENAGDDMLDARLVTNLSKVHLPRDGEEREGEGMSHSPPVARKRMRVTTSSVNPGRGRGRGGLIGADEGVVAEMATSQTKHKEPRKESTARSAGTDNASRHTRKVKKGMSLAVLVSLCV